MSTRSNDSKAQAEESGGIFLENMGDQSVASKVRDDTIPAQELGSNIIRSSDMEHGYDSAVACGKVR
ncbi:hypothetical protein ABVK25_010562 [Lepraria finkii]|uniref:Uncharacterized protein n=1 Tax=Lepraria finkii TaxID=1340010 RepID=A0ABR4AUE8_9LECA